MGPPSEFNLRLSFTTDGSRLVAGHFHTTVVNTTSLTEVEFNPPPLLGNAAFSADGRMAYAILGEPNSIAILPIAQLPAPPPGLTARWMFDGTGTDILGGRTE